MTKPLVVFLRWLAPARRAGTWRRDAAIVLRALVAQRYDRRIAGCPPMAVFAVSEPPRFLPGWIRAAAAGLIGRVERYGGAGLVLAGGYAEVAERSARGWAATALERLEARFSYAFERDNDARVAARLFTSAIALSCAGVVALAAVGPHPAVHLPHPARTETASGPTLEAASAAPAGAPAAAAPAEAAPAPAPATAPAPAPAAAAPAAPAVVQGEGRGGLPIGKGMWIWLHDRAEGGNVDAIVERARIWGFSHLYVRTGTLREGFIAGPFLDRLLPVAHANNIRVYGWDFPFMNDPGADIARANAAIRHTTPDGHRIDGFAPDIETRSEGTNENVENVRAYVNFLRLSVGPDYPLIAVIPNPTPGRIARGYPFADIVAPFDAVAPMVYWMNREPGADVANAISFLQQFGKPVFPVGQAYDGAIDGGPAGIPNRDAIHRFMQVADQFGAVSVSFWSWQHASGEAWDAISDAVEFRLEVGAPETLRPMVVRAYQLQLAYLGYPVAATGQWTPETAAAVTAFQRDSGLPQTGIVDAATRDALTRPRAATIRPVGA